MKSATFPSLRVHPDLRKAAEDVLEDDESLSSFVEQSVRANIERRKTQEEFIARGLASRDKAKRSGIYVASGDVVKSLATRLAKARAKKKSA
jgi:predicted transcriptional regulator